MLLLRGIGVLILLVFSSVTYAQALDCGDHAYDQQGQETTSERVVQIVNHYALKKVRKSRKHYAPQEVKQQPRGWYFAGINASVKDNRLSGTSIKFVYAFR